MNSEWFVLNRTGIKVWSADINPNQLHIFEVNWFSSAREVSGTIIFEKFKPKANYKEDEKVFLTLQSAAACSSKAEA
jgi:hypothetical protein